MPVKLLKSVKALQDAKNHSSFGKFFNEKEAKTARLL